MIIDKETKRIENLEFLHGKFKDVIISDNIESARTLFENNVVTYDTSDDLNEKVNFYLNNVSERYKMKEAGIAILAINILIWGIMSLNS